MKQDEQTGELNFTQTDFVELPKSKNETTPHSEVDNLFLSKVIKENYYFSDSINYEATILAQQIKIDYHHELLNGQKIINVNDKIDDIIYYRMMYKSIIRAIVADDSLYNYIKINNLTMADNDMLADYFSTIFTDQSLNENKLEDNITLDLTKAINSDLYSMRNHPNREMLLVNPIKKYQKGMKLTRFFVSLSEMLNSKSSEMEKRIGRFRIDPSERINIFISAYLPSFIKAGAIGRSCLSQGGVNEHAAFMTLGYKNLLVAHDVDFQYRAWLAVDYKQKFYTLAHTYPRENFFLQLMVHEHMKGLGFTHITNYFSFPSYMDMGAAQNFDAVDFYSIKTDDLDTNKDAYFEWTKSLFEDDSRGGKRHRIAIEYSCSGCDKTSVRPDFLEDGEYCNDCQDRDDDYYYCADCGEREQNDYANYDEDTEQYYCNSCYESLQEKRAEDEEEEEQETPSISETPISIDYTLIKRAPDNEYPHLMKHIEQNSHLFVTEEDVRILASKPQKVSNYREFKLYGSLLTGSGVLWRAGESPLDYNPNKRGVGYSYYMFLENNHNDKTFVLYNARNIDVAWSEDYIRYFYLARNKLYGMKHQENAIELFKTKNPDVEITEDLQKVFDTNFTYATIKQLTNSDDNNIRLHAKDLETAQKLLVILSSVGYRLNSFQNLLTTDYLYGYSGTTIIIDKKGSAVLSNDTAHSIEITNDMISGLPQLKK